MTLTKDEREKFAAWLEAQAESAKAIVEGLQRLGPFGEVAAKRERQEAAAALLIAGKLRAIEDSSLDG